MAKVAKKATVAAFKDEAAPLTAEENAALAVAITHRTYEAHVPIGQIEALVASIEGFCDVLNDACVRSGKHERRALGHVITTVGMLEDRCRDLRRTLYGERMSP